LALGFCKFSEKTIRWTNGTDYLNINTHTPKSLYLIITKLQKKYFWKNIENLKMISIQLKILMI